MRNSLTGASATAASRASYAGDVARTTLSKSTRSTRSPRRAAVMPRNAAMTATPATEGIRTVLMRRILLSELGSSYGAQECLETGFVSVGDCWIFHGAIPPRLSGKCRRRVLPQAVHDHAIGESRQVHVPVRDRRSGELRVIAACVTRGQLIVPELLADVIGVERSEYPRADVMLGIARVRVRCPENAGTILRAVRRHRQNRPALSRR